MKRFLMASLLAGIVYLLTPSTSQAQVISVFSSVVANTDTTTMATKPTGFSTSGTIACGKSCSWRIWSDGVAASGGTTANAYCRMSSSDSEPWYLCDTVLNPGTTGSNRLLPAEREYKFTVEAYSAGSIHVKFYSSSN